jgi:RNA polymerase sigma-70 factor (ECF subfamily)
MELTPSQEFEKIFDEYADPIFRHCFFRLFNRETAKDLTQETFMKTWDYIGKGNKIDNMRAFLYKVANNLVINEIKRKKPEGSLDEMSAETDFDPISEHAMTDPKAQSEEIEVLDKLKQLHPSYREVIIMRYVDDLNVKEIAKMLNETESNISVKIHRGIKKLQEIYKIK